MKMYEIKGGTTFSSVHFLYVPSHDSFPILEWILTVVVSCDQC